MKLIKKYNRHILIGIISGLLNGLLGAGGGSIVVPAMVMFLDIEQKKAHSTAIAIILVMSAVSSFFYIKNGFFDINLWLPVTIGGCAGGMLGAKFLSKIPVKWLKIIFGTVILTTAFKMVF